MALFKCFRCMQVYEDFYPVDDTCIRCKRGTVRVLKEELCAVNTAKKS